MHPELFALLASARAIVDRDLRRIEPENGAGLGWHLQIPRKHVAGWLSALNAARLTLAELHDIGEEEMAREDLEVCDERTAAVAKIHLLGLLQQLLIEGTERPGV